MTQEAVFIKLGMEKMQNICKKRLIARLALATVFMQLTAMEQKVQLPPPLVSLCCLVLEKEFTYCDYSKAKALQDLKHFAQAPLANPAKKQLVQTLLKRIPEQPVHLFTIPRVCFDAKYSPTRDTIAIREKQGVSLWDANIGQYKGIITVNHIRHFTFSPQGTYLIAQAQGTAYIFDVKTQRYLFKVSDCRHMLCSPDETKLIVEKEHNLDWHKLPSGELLTCNAGATTPRLLACNNQYVAYKQGLMLTIDIIDFTGKKEPVVLPGIAATFSPPGEYNVAGVSLHTILLAVAETSGSIILYDAATLNPLINFVVPEAPCYTLTFSTDCKRLFIQSGKNYSIWDCTTGTRLCSLDRNFYEREVTMHPDVSYALIEQGKTLYMKPFNKEATVLAFITDCIYPHLSSDGSTFLIEGSDNKASLFSVEKKQLIGTFTDAWQTTLEARAVYSPDGKKLMISPDDHCTHVWHLHPLDADEISLQEALALLFLKKYHAIDKKICALAYEILHKTPNQNLKKFVLTYYR